MERTRRSMEDAMGLISSLTSGSDSKEALENRKHRIQEGLRRAAALEEELQKEGILTIEVGENETFSIPQGAIETVISADYCADGAQTSVLGRLNKDLLSGSQLLVRNDIMGCDPKPGVRKVLRVRYRPRKESICVTAEEGQEICIPPHAAEALVSARYGEGDTWWDVLADAQALFVVNKGRFVVRNDALGGDPKPNVIKQLIVEYRANRQRMSVKLTTNQELATFEVIALGLFRDLHAAIGVSPQALYESLTAHEIAGGEKQASGKSGEIFWFTKDNRFVLKTISDAEVATLVQMLRDYTEYLARNPDSLLTRYLGAFSLEDNGTTTQFVVMNNVFEGAPDLDVMYDLKGTTEDRWVDPEPGRCLKDNNFEGVTVYCEDTVASQIHKALGSDTRFLEGRGIMDYSLMCAFAYTKSGERLRRYSKLMGGLEVCEATGVLGDSKRECLFFIGMVDMLVTYGWKKVAAHTVKSLTIGITQEIDTVPPDRYAARFRSFFARKILGKSEQAPVTEVRADPFVTPFPGLGRSGGTAAFFKVSYRDGVNTPEARQSKDYWIGKDLARAKDEVTFYEAAKALQGQAGWEVLGWMTPYMGVCRADCEVEAGKPPRPVDVMLLRNGRDGFRSCRMLDVKMGQATAVAGWQGKSAFSAWLQANTIDAYTNTAGQGFRLEGFDNPPETLRSMEELLLSKLGATQSMASKLKRFNLQRMTGTDFLGLFLDVHEVSAASSYGQRHASQLPRPLTEDAQRLLRVETQELVLLSCIEELSAFIAACRRVPAPQQWIGSSVMLCFDGGRLPGREALQRGPRHWGVARVHVFDWGRSELNMRAMYERMEPETQVERQKYWGYYCAAASKLLYDCCAVYVRRFWHPKRTLAFTVWDKDHFTPDEFAGTCSLPFQELSQQKVPLTDLQGSTIKTGLLRGSEATVCVSASRQALPPDSRLQDGWAVTVHWARGLPSKDLATQNDSVVEVATLPEEPGTIRGGLAEAVNQRLLRDGAHLTSLALDAEAPVWEEVFQVATLTPGARAAFLHALAVAVGDATPRPNPEELVPRLFPCHIGQVADTSADALRQDFAGLCFPGIVLDRSFLG